MLATGEREICIEAHRHASRFVSATAEEFGDVGTPVYAKRFAKHLPPVDLMINTDCVGGALCPLCVRVPKRDSVVPLLKKLVTPYRSLRVVPGKLSPARMADTALFLRDLVEAYDRRRRA